MASPVPWWPDPVPGPVDGPGEKTNKIGMTMAAKGSQSLRNVETRKKKARRAIPRAKVTRIQGNSPAARKRLKKQAAKTANTRYKASAAAG